MPHTDHRTTREAQLARRLAKAEDRIDELEQALRRYLTADAALTALSDSDGDTWVDALSEKIEARRAAFAALEGPGS